ncbi:MAG: tetraacyldisaccharide 4'-kinase [Phycisphaerae bacterium]|nr:tetraacyldisaccharide 4'-kinase [Phycisphaerae bacterium]
MSRSTGKPPLILASRSPRRAGLLRAAGYRFEQIPSNYDEAAHALGSPATAAGLAEQLARAKAQAVAATVERGLVLGCDTLVELDGQALGKADSPQAAAEMIRRLAGRDHDVITAVCLVDAESGRCHGAVDRATVTLGPLDDQAIEQHIRSGKWQGKAGAYNLEEMQAHWPLAVRGDPTTVVGLPMAHLRHLLQQFGQTPARPAAPTATPRWEAVLSGADRSLSARLLRLATGAAEPLYRGLIALRNRAYDHGWKRTIRVGKPVISIGNLTAGGTGKTPMVIYTARLLLDRGHRPAVILRGYRSGADGSDEQRLITEALDGVPVVANPDRVAAARTLLEQHPEVDCLILDDAFQHRRIGRDLDLVLADATKAFGFDHVLPRGLLREALAQLRRAGAVVISRADLVDDEQRAAVRDRIEREHGRPPLAEAIHQWARILDETDAPVEDSPAKLFAFAGIGNPQAFFRQAAGRFALAGQRALPDHFHYDQQKLQDLAAEAKALGAHALFTTEKDFVKIRTIVREQPVGLPIYRPELRLGFAAGEAELEDVILRAVAGAAPA